MDDSNPNQGNSRSFPWIDTIVWILVAGVIAGTLITILLPTCPHPPVRMLEAKAQKVCTELRNGVTNYYTEYKHYPEFDARDENGDVRTDTASDSEFIATLIGLNSERNPRAISFFTAKTTSTARSPGLWVGEDHTTAHLLDPWGNPYQVIFDANYDNKVTVPDRGGTGTMELFAGAAAWSYGPNGIPGPGEKRKNDDIFSY